MEHGPEESPAFYFANRGYDVWMLNQRGNYFSRNHTTLNPDVDHEFWDIDLIDWAHDLRPTVEYILEVTEYINLIVMGSGTSSTTSIAAYDLDPEFFHEHVSISIQKTTSTSNRTVTNLPTMPFFNHPFYLPTLRNLGILEILTYQPEYNNFVSKI